MTNAELHAYNFGYATAQGGGELGLSPADLAVRVDRVGQAAVRDALARLGPEDFATWALQGVSDWNRNHPPAA